jgi:hypothetical protein
LLLATVRNHFFELVTIGSLFASFSPEPPQVEDGYIAGIAAHRPAVISLNMFAAGLAVTELLARLHPFREEPNSVYASVIFSLASVEFITEAEGGICKILAGHVGVGDVVPLLGLTELAERRK